MTSAKTHNSEISSMTYASTISIKLDDENFLVWEHQILATIHGLHFYHFLYGTPPPPKFLTPTTEVSSMVNHAYIHH